MEPKAQTYQQKLGFFDTDLKKPKHDEIMFWLEKQIVTHVEKLLKMFKEMHPASETNRNIKVNRSSITWEYPIKQINNKNDSIYLIGYIDLRLEVVIIHEIYEMVEENLGLKEYIWKSRRKTFVVYYEVKTEIKSVGELLRQINTYRVYSRPDFFYIVCPDDTHSAFLKTQEVNFIKYEEKVNL